jgi:hypothetical protein
MLRCPGQDMRFWKPEDIFEVRCSSCGNGIEFFKDDPARTCRSCGKKVRNPRLDLGCASWCHHATECLGQGRQDEDAADYLCDRLIERMKAVFGDDRRRIDHALKVLEYADAIMKSERNLSAIVVRAAAVLHDIGIHEAERKHGSSAGKYQELEGPPIARQILQEQNADPEEIEHICRIVANHHHAKSIDTPEFRVVWDADWLVNIPDEFDLKDRPRIERLIARVFRTEGGRRIAKTVLTQGVVQFSRGDALD